MVVFDGEEFFIDPGNDIESYVWEVLDPVGNPLRSVKMKWMGSDWKLVDENDEPMGAPLADGPAFRFQSKAPGVYQIRGTATDKNGALASVTRTIQVTGAEPLVDGLPALIPGTEGDAIPLDAHQYFDARPDGETYRYRWEVRSGGPAGPIVVVSNARYLDFTSPDNGVYAVSLWVRDEEGNQSNTASTTLTVSNALPVVNITGPASGVEGSALAFQGRRGTEVTDPGFADVDSLSLAWLVTRSGQTIAIGSAEDFSFTPGDNGTYHLRLTATDKDGGSASTERTITVTNAGPTVAVGSDTNGAEGVVRAFSAVVADPGSAENLVYFWQAILGGNVVASAATSTFNFTPSNNGLYTILLTVTDKDGTSGQDDLLFTVGNKAPLVAFPTPTVQANEGQSLSWHASALVSDAVGDVLVKTWELFRLAGDGSRVAEATTNGESFTRLFPDNGTWILRLTATDPDGASGSAELIIQVNNVAPVLTISGPAQGVVGGQSTLTGSWTDVPADTATGIARVFINNIEQTARPPVFLSGNTFTLGLVPTAPGDYRVEVTIRDNFGAASVINHQMAVSTGVVGRHLFYNNSAFDERNPAADANDDAALAPDKRALLPGQVATFANYSSYAKGINGLMIDLAGLADPAGLSLADFEFRVGNSDDPSSWSLAPSPTLGPIRTGADLYGAHRVTLIWPDGAIVGQWLQVRVKANAVTGLATDDIFYFGNAPGDTGNNTIDFAIVDAADLSITAANQSGFLNPTEIENPHDFNRDGRVNAFDIAITRNRATNPGNALRLISLVPPAPAPMAAPMFFEPETESAESVNETIPQPASSLVIEPPAEPPALSTAENEAESSLEEQTTGVPAPFVPLTTRGPVAPPTPERVFYQDIRFATPAERGAAEDLRDLVARLPMESGESTEEEPAAVTMEWVAPSALPVFGERDTSIDPLIFPAVANRPSAAPEYEPDEAPESNDSITARSWERFTSLLRNLNL